MVIAAICVLAQLGVAAEVEVSFQPVVLDLEGAPTTISHYLLYYGRTSRPKLIHHPSDRRFRYEGTLNLGQVMSKRVRGLEVGFVWYFSVVAVDRAGNLSDYSEEAALPVPDASGQVSQAKALPDLSAAGASPESRTACGSAPPGEIGLLVWLLLRRRQINARSP